MNHELQGYYILFGIVIDGLKGPAIPQFSQDMELDIYVSERVPKIFAASLDKKLDGFWYHHC